MPELAKPTEAIRPVQVWRCDTRPHPDYPDKPESKCNAVLYTGGTPPPAQVYCRRCRQHKTLAG